MESVMKLMREVECEEKAAEQAKEDAAQSSLHFLVKLDECKKALRQAEETNDMLVRKLCVQKAALATKMEVFQLRSSHLLDNGDKFLQVLDGMSRSLETRLTSALMKKELAVKKKQANEHFTEAALACEGIQMKKVEQEFKNLKQEVRETSKLMEFLIDGGQALDRLHEKISDKYQNVKHLKEEVEQGSPLMSILESFKLDCHCSKNEAVIETVRKEGPSISSDDFVENSRDVKNRLCGNKLCGKSIKKVKIKKNHKSVKKIKITGLQVVTKRTTAADHQDDDDILVSELLH
ncbi:uncharacterized protein LOC143601626 [Bidens hawaiensis]|uniref:uncharacterized protein LOC143601626 n=1 Tax=Bidens hawaiensis TaxID=980011 RepID=UPI00404B0931